MMKAKVTSLAAKLRSRSRAPKRNMSFPRVGPEGGPRAQADQILRERDMAAAANMEPVIDLTKDMDQRQMPKPRRGDTASRPLVLLNRPPPPTVDRRRCDLARRAHSLGLISTTELGVGETRYNQGRIDAAKRPKHAVSTALTIMESSPPPPNGGSETSMGVESEIPGGPALDEATSSGGEPDGTLVTEEQAEQRMKDQSGNKSKNYTDIWNKFGQFIGSDYFARRRTKGDIEFATAKQGKVTREVPVFTVLVLRAFSAWLLMPEQGRGQKSLDQIRYGVNDGYERLVPSLGRPWTTSKDGPDSGGRLNDIEMTSYAINRVKCDVERGVVRKSGGAPTFKEAGISWMLNRADQIDKQLDTMPLHGSPAPVHKRNRDLTIKLFSYVMLLLTMLIFMLRACSAQFSEDEEYLEWHEDGSMTLVISYWKQTRGSPPIREKQSRHLPVGSGVDHPRDRYLALMKKLQERGGLPNLEPTAAPISANRSRPRAAKRALTGASTTEKILEKEMAKQIDEITLLIFGKENVKRFSDNPAKSMTSQTYRKTGCSAALKAGGSEIAITTWGLWKNKIPEKAYVNPRYMVTTNTMRLFDFLCR